MNNNNNNIIIKMINFFMHMIYFAMDKLDYSEI